MRAIIDIYKEEKKAYLTVDGISVSSISFQEYYTEKNFVNFDNKTTFQNVKIQKH